jgi:hypothetical protein
MAGEFFVLDEAFTKKKKTVIVVGAVLVVLLGGTLIAGQAGGLVGDETPTPSVVAIATSPSLVTVEPLATATNTYQPATTTPTAIPSSTATPLPGPTDTAPVPTATPHPPTPTSTPTLTPRPPTPTPSPSPTPRSPTPTPSPSPTPRPPTPTPTFTPVSRRGPIIENPADGSQLPVEELTVDGTTEPDTTVEVYEGDTLLGEAQADESGNWSLVPAEPLPAGDHTIVAVDVATDQVSAPVTFTLSEPQLPVTGREQSREKTSPH